MDIDAILGNDGYHVKNPYYKKGNGQPEFIITDDPKYAPRNTSDLVVESFKRGELGSLGESSDYKKYVKAGITPSPVDNINNYELILAEHQSRGEKWKNALGQTIVNELLLGTVKSFTDLADIVTGAAFRSDNDYQNAASRYLEELQNKFKENHEIYVDPNVSLGNGALGSAGWWASNFPSIMSTLTLLIPAKGAVSAVGLVGKAAKYAGKGTKAAKAVRAFEKAHKLGKNTERGVAARRMFENGVAAVTMRTLENYQEGRQVYNDVYKQTSEELNNMTPEQYQEFINKNKNVDTFWGTSLEDSNIDLNDRDAVARQISHNAANKTFISDYQNIIWDVVQINALRNPLKYSKNMRRTAAVNKTQRERILATMKAAGINTEEGGKKALTKNVGNWFKDRLGAGQIVVSELSEGVEEAVNYIAQQEGMHYANVMFGKEENNDFWNDRLWEYLGNAQLYDAAFWGVLGGVGFQLGGSGINRLSNAIEGKRLEKKQDKKGTKTKEKVNTNFLDRFMSSEDKIRTNSMSDVVIQFNSLKDKLNLIKDNTDPYNTERKFTTHDQNDDEHNEARRRAIEEFMTSIAFDAIDSGTWDLTKDYLRDEGVQEAMKQIGVTDSESGDIESLISFMDKIEDDYTNELTRVSDIASSLEDMPFEYIQIIGRNNTKAKQELDRIERNINKYNIQGEEDFNLFKDNLPDKDVDYKRAVQLKLASERISQLNALKKDINSSKKRRESIDGRYQLNQIDKELNIIYNYILDSTSVADDTVRQVSELMYIIGNASQTEFNDKSGYTTNKYSDEYLDFKQDVATGNLAAILKKRETELGSRQFKLTDEKIIQVFGDFKNQDYNGLYQSLKSTMDTVFDSEAGLKKRAPKLFEDYSTLSWLEQRRLELLSRMHTTTESVNMKVQELHNDMNKARTAAIAQSYEIIGNLVKQYGYDRMYDAIFSNSPIDDMTESDRTKLSDALEVLNLTSSNNAALAQRIKQQMLLDAIQSERESVDDEEETGENSSTSENSISGVQGQELNNPLTSTQNPSSEPETDQNGQKLYPKPFADTNSSKEQKAVISIDTDGKLDATSVDFDSKDFGFEYTITNNGQVVLNAKQADVMGEIPTNILANSSLFDGYDANNKNSFDIVKNPIIARDDNDNWYVVERGEIRYKQPAGTSSILPTGEVESKPKDEVPVGLVIDVEAQQAEQNKLVNEVKPILKERIYSLPKNSTEEDIDRIIVELKEQFKGKYNIEDSTFNSLFNRLHKLALNTARKENILKAAIDVSFSTIIEENGNFTFGDDFKKAVSKLVEVYSKEYNLDKIDDKYYVSLEDLFRRINYLYDDSSLSESMFSSMVAYLQSNEGKNRYIITDTNIISALKNANISAEKRRDEIMGNSENLRVSIDKFFQNPSEQYQKAFASLREGDILKYEVIGDRIALKKNGVTIGELPFPDVISNTGGFSKENMGWIETVWYDNKTQQYQSTLTTFYEKLLEHKDNLFDTIYNNLRQLNYDKSFQGKKRDALVTSTRQLIEQALKNTYQNIDDILNTNETDARIVRHLANIIGYFNHNVVNQELYIQDSVNSWFKKLYDSYKIIDNLRNIKDAKITISRITSGEVIHKISATDSEARRAKNYKDMTQSNVAFAEGTEPVIGIVSRSNPNLFISSERDLDITTQMPDRQQGYVYAVIKKNNRDSKGAYERENADFVVCTGARLSDAHRDFKGDAKEVFKAIRDEVNYLVDEFSKNPTEKNFNKLNSFTSQVFQSQIDAGYEKINPGFTFGVRYVDEPEYNKFTLNLSDDIAVQFNKGKPRTNEDLSVTTTYFSIKQSKDGKFARLQSTPENIKLVKDIINQCFNKAQFNVGTQHIYGDRDSSLPTGLITRDSSTREAIITIPNSKTGKTLVKRYKSFSDLIIKGGFVRVNTEVRNGSNYAHKGVDEAANQTLQVKIETSSSTPVERIEQEISTTKPTIKDVFKLDVADIDDILSKSNLPKSAINLLKELQLLPNSIIFDANLNTEKDTNGKWIGPNAEYHNDTRIITVGNKWIDMFDETGQFVVEPKGEPRAQAIRKLIHEQLHAKIHSDETKRDSYINRIRDIYSEFEKHLNDNKVADDDKLRQYLFYPIYKKVINKKTGVEEKQLIRGYAEEDRRLEEFLVESLTSKQLADYLNTIPTTTENKKETLFDKIRNFIKEILGLDVKEGNLLEKELNTIQDLFVVDVEKSNNYSDEGIKEQVEEKPKESSKRRRSNKVEGDSKRIQSTVTESVEDRYTPEMREIKEKSIADGTFMKAPNGNPTNLTERQWLQVRTKAFKEWFGDWINDPANASKVVDENGEPLVVYHGTDNDFTVFEKRDTAGIFFTPDKKDASSYGRNIIEVFLKIKDLYNSKEGNFEHLKKSDGTIDENYNNHYTVNDPNQIKSATDNVGTFSKEDNNIYHSDIIEESPNIYYPSFTDFAYMTDNPARTIEAALNGEINIRCK